MEAAVDQIGPIVRELRRHAANVRYELVREHDEIVAPVRPALVVVTADAARREDLRGRVGSLRRDRRVRLLRPGWPGGANRPVDRNPM